jgi:hypothetical protein
MRKTEDDNPVGSAYGANQKKERDILFSLYVHMSVISYSELTH